MIFFLFFMHGQLTYYNRIYRKRLLGHASSKTTEIYTFVSARVIGNIKRPIGYLNLNPKDAVPDIRHEL